MMERLNTALLFLNPFEQIKHVNVSVIASNIQAFKRLKDKNNYKSELASFCQNLLLNAVISPNEVVSFSNSKLAKAYGVDSVIIENCDNDDLYRKGGEFTENTSVAIKTFHSKDYHSLKLKLSKKDLHLAGLTTEVERLSKLLKMTSSRRGSMSLLPKGVLVHGPPGCGKSLLAQQVAQICDAVFVQLEPSQLLKSEHGAGAEALKTVFNKAVTLTEEGAVVVFLDDIDSLCPNSAEASMGLKQITSALISVLDDIHDKNVSNLLVIGATNSISSVAKTLRRPGRFDQEILVNVPTRDQRMSILRLMTSGYQLSGNVSMDTIALRTAGYVGADLRALCEEAENKAYQRNSQLDAGMSVVIDMSDFEHALHLVKPSLRKGLDCTVDLAQVKWEDIGGLEEIKMEIKQSIEWPLLHNDALRRMDLTPTKGILLYGPPGCCKTTLVKAVATSCHVNFLSLTGAQVFSAYVGQSEKIISEAFQKARALSPCILFFDEVDTLVGKRSAKGTHSHVQERILATLLNEMDGIGVRLDRKVNVSTRKPVEEQKQVPDLAEMSQESTMDLQAESSKSKTITQSQVMVVGATNRPDMIDAALLRPGRLDKLIYVPPPDAEARKSILNVYTSKMSTENIDISSLTQETEGYSGADLKNLCKEAGLLAVREILSQSTSSGLKCPRVCDKHMRQALATVHPSLTQEMLSCYK